MPRRARIESGTGIFHVMMRGINHLSLCFLLNGYLKRSLRVTTFWNALLYWLFASPYVVTSTG